MQSDEKALTNGLLFGSDEGFSLQLQQLTRDAGVSHLVAASGANLRLVESLWSLVFWPLGITFVQSTSLVAILGYWFLAEQSGSLWRASVMWVLTWGGRLRGRKVPAWYSLGGVVAVTVLATPAFLTPGFWLSVLAILGLFFSHHVLSGEKKRAVFPQRCLLRNSVTLSLAEGSWIFTMVTVWLWTQYKVFQPIGILSTLVLGFLVEPLIWFGIGESLFLKVVQSAQELPPFLETGQEGVFAVFWVTLEVFAHAAQVLPSWFLAVCSAALLQHSLNRWWRQRARWQRWKGIDA